ncbi:type 4b pilus protein PilO2 [[Empedobacter] haloabium]|uniref:Type 4b pilus protein PilO2 n=1 Tax=[Empedobacter] haloabium TaxID=592317 RepID=A0ABZ1UK04_9BURK
MAIHITQIGKHRFVCGLFWQSLSRPRELQREAADLGKKIASDLVVVRRDQSTAQAGFAQSSEGATRALYSLGAAVSKTLALEGAWYDGLQQPVHNWLGALKLADGQWAYFAVRDANFLPNGDFVGSKEEVLDRLHADYALGGWNVVIGDAELENQGFHNFNARDLDSLLPRRKDGSVRLHSWWRLRQINARRSPWALIGAGAAVAAVGGAALYYQAWQARQEALRQEEAIMAQRRVLQQQAVQVKPWATLPAPATALRACADGLGELTPGGWLLDEYVCERDQLRHAWSRQASTIAMLRAVVPTADVDPGGDRATLVQARKPAKPHEAEALMGRQDVVDAVMSRLQGVGIPFKVLRKKPPPPVPGQVAPNEPWQEYQFALEAAGIEPQQIGALLSQPGVRVEKATYRGMRWIIEGVIYAK